MSSSQHDGTEDRPEPAIEATVKPETETETGAGTEPAPHRPIKAAPVFPEDLVRVTAWVDPVLDKLGHDPRSGYVERYWLSILGPSCLFLLRRLAAKLEREPDGFDLDTVQWAGELGLGMKGGRNGPFWRSIERGCRFGAAQRNGSLLAVRRRLPPLTVRQVERLPESLQRSHQVWAETRLAMPRRATVTKWPQHRERPNTPEAAGVSEHSGIPEVSQVSEVSEQTWDDAA